MPEYPTTTQRAEELQSLMAALSVIQIAGLDLGEKPPIMPLKYAGYLIAADAHLLIIPATEATADHDIVEELIDFSRCDAVMISVVRSPTEGNRVVVDIGIRDRLPVWYKRYRPCLLDRALHFVPDQDPARPAFKLTKDGLFAAVEFDELDSA
jgi:hypothetical protein